MVIHIHAAIHSVELMSPTPIDLQILPAIQARLQGARAGVTVRYGEIEPTPDDALPLILFSDTAYDIDERMSGSDITMTLTIAYYLQWNDGEPFDVLALRGDIKRALFLDADRQLGGLVEELALVGQTTTARQPGGGTIGGGLTIAVKYAEAFGAPEAVAA